VTISLEERIARLATVMEHESERRVADISAMPPRPSPRSPRARVLTALAIVVVSALATFTVIRLVNDDTSPTRRTPAATAANPSLPVDPSRCAIRLTAKRTTVCLTAYDETKVSYVLTGFKPRTSYRAATVDSSTSGGGKIDANGTNVNPPKKPSSGRGSGTDGSSFGGSSPLFTQGLVITGTTADNASVTFFVPPPPPTSSPASNDAERLGHRPDYLVIADNSHLRIGAACDPYGPAVLATIKKHQVGLEVFYPTTPGPRLLCLTTFTITLPTPLGSRALVDADGQTVAVDGDNRCTPPRQGTRCDTP
jgi:hypothetical protein